MVWQQICGWFAGDGYYNQLEKNIEALRGGDKSRIPWIFCIFAENYAPSRLAAARALQEVLYTLSFDDIIRIDRQMRQTTSMEWGRNWRELDINDFFTHQMDVDERRAVIIFASFNPNGFIRERAVEMMKDYDWTLPYIILRQNDWVGQVRQTASAAFAYRLQHLSEGEILAALPFVDKLKRCVRGSHDEHTNLFYEVLATPDNEHNLKQGLESANVRTRRVCIDALFAIPHLNTELAFERLTNEPDPFLRTKIFRKLKDRGLKMDKVANLFLNDKYPMNRLLAFQYLLDTNASNIHEIAEKLLLDKNAVVREFAQNTMRKQVPEFDFRGFYINHLNQCPAVAICGLSEKGLPDDANEIAVFLEDTRIGVVKSAMMAVMRLNSEEYHPTIINMLDDARESIVKTARNLLLKNCQCDYDKIKGIFHTSTFEYTRLICMDILFSAPKWQCLIFILETMLDKAQAIKLKALESLIYWLVHFNRSFAQPNETQMAEIRKLIDSVIIPPGVEKELLFTLGLFPGFKNRG